MNNAVMLPLHSRPSIIDISRGTFGKDPENRILDFRSGNVWWIHFYSYYGKLIIDESPYCLTPQSISLISPGSHARWCLEGISIHSTVFFTFPIHEGRSISVTPVIQIPEGKPIHSVVEKIWQYYPFQRDRAEILFWNMLWTIYGDHENPESHTGPGTDRRLESAVRFIEQNLSENLTVRKIANEVNLSTNHLARLFKDTFRITLLAYLRKRRMENARHLIEYSTIPMKVIAHQVGVHDLPYFHRCFKREFSISPGSFRRGDKIKLTE